MHEGVHPGDTVERYRVESELGRGGMAVVYRVVHTRLGTTHALKVLLTEQPSVRSRLLELAAGYLPPQRFGDDAAWLQPAGLASGAGIEGAFVLARSLIT